MGETDALPRFVLGPGAAKQVKNALMVLGRDAASIVGDLEDRKAQFGAAADRDVDNVSCAYTSKERRLTSRLIQ